MGIVVQFPEKAEHSRKRLQRAVQLMQDALHKQKAHEHNPETPVEPQDKAALINNY